MKNHKVYIIWSLCFVTCDCDGQLAKTAFLTSRRNVSWYQRKHSGACVALAEKMISPSTCHIQYNSFSIFDTGQFSFFVFFNFFSRTNGQQYVRVEKEEIQSAHCHVIMFFSFPLPSGHAETYLRQLLQSIFTVRVLLCDSREMFQEKVSHFFKIFSYLLIRW